MSKKHTKQLLSNPILISTLLLGVLIPVGLLSYWGALIIYPSEAFGILAFFLNGFVDGEVYLDNIKGGLQDPLLLGEEGMHALICKALDSHLTKYPPSDTCDSFTRDYYEWRLYTKKHPEDSAAAKRVRRMQKYFVKSMLSSDHHQELLHIPSYKNLVLTLEKQLPTMRYKIWALRAAVLISVLSGLAFGLVTASSLTALATTSSFLLSVTTPLAITAFLGYSLLTFHNMKRILFSETVDKWSALLNDWFIKKPEKMNLFVYGLRVLSAAILIPTSIALSVIATLTTGYTWWIAIENNYLRKLLVPVAVVTNFLFAQKNSLDSVREIQNGFAAFLDRPFAGARQSLASFLNHENSLQRINVFRLLDKIITVSFDTLLLVAHSVAVALTGDRYPGYERSSLIGGAVADFFIDKSYIGHDHHENEHHDHGCAHEHADLNEENDDHHDHAITAFIRSYVLNTALFPLRCLAIGWDSLASQLNGDNHHDRSRLSINEAYKKYFPIDTHTAHQHTAHQPNTSDFWICEEIKLRTQKEISRINAANPANKNDLIKHINHISDTVAAHKIAANKHTPRFHYQASNDRCSLFANRISRDYLTNTAKQSKPRAMQVQ